MVLLRVLACRSFAASNGAVLCAAARMRSWWWWLFSLLKCVPVYGVAPIWFVILFFLEVRSLFALSAPPASLRCCPVRLAALCGRVASPTGSLRRVPACLRPSLLEAVSAQPAFPVTDLQDHGDEYRMVSFILELKGESAFSAASSRWLWPLSLRGCPAQLSLFSVARFLLCCLLLILCSPQHTLSRGLSGD